MHKNRFRGFTLIELLVVIAIIGILSAVVLASLTTARQKGSDAAIQSDLNTIQTQAELYYNDTSGGNQSYGTQAWASGADTVCTGGLFGQSNIKAAMHNAYVDSGGSSGKVTCVANGQTYAVGVQLLSNTSNWWCVDNTGSAKLETGAFPTASFAC